MKFKFQTTKAIRLWLVTAFFASIYATVTSLSKSITVLDLDDFSFGPPSPQVKMPPTFRNYSSLVEEIEFCIPNGTYLPEFFTEFDDLVSTYEHDQLFFRKGLSGTEEMGRPNATVCVFRQMGPWDQFAHTMQQLYRCFSYFQSHPTSEHILTMSNPPHDFAVDFVQALHDKFNVLIDRNMTYVHHINARNVDQPGTHAQKRRVPHQVLNKTHLKIMRDGIVGDKRSSPGCEDQPRIGFLNREWVPPGNRYVVNHRQLTEELRRQFGQYANVIYLSSFDNMTMLEQATWMSNVDILISPHGAQLTNIPFMPDNGAVLELSPVGIYQPNWFGSLAGTSDIRFAVLYTGANQTEETQIWMTSVKRKEQARRFGVCPNLNYVIKAVAQMLEDWRERTCPTVK